MRKFWQMAPRRPKFWLAWSLCIIVLDQLSKIYFDSSLHYGERVPVIEGFWNWTLAYNPGAAFSFLADAGGWQHYFFSGLALLISAFLLRQLIKTPQSLALDMATMLILSGALGNLIDRLLYGHVIDFIQWYWRDFVWPAFNLADSAISLGVVLMLLDALFGKKHDNTLSQT